MNILKKFLLLIKQKKNYLITHAELMNKKINKNLLLIGSFQKYI